MNETASTTSAEAPCACIMTDVNFALLVVAVFFMGFGLAQCLYSTCLDKRDKELDQTRAELARVLAVARGAGIQI